ncbi:hypothetical protein KC992_03425 [Candidatus Saccharibacteria bacterium]|nr:hypothetical protein [Candidatus Saccharibacteria bacterium]MCA9328737.1 hypothetical protein [Candidatus Saccharibacteria bacterium]
MILNPITERMIQGYIDRPHSSLLLVGDEDDGASDILSHLSKMLLSNENKNNSIILEPQDNKGIRVEQIREFKKSLISTLGRGSGVARVAIIKNAESSSHEAQNALLKLIEEPVDRTALIIQVAERSKLLPTIQSRCQTISVLPITEVQAEEYAALHSVHNNKQIEQMLLLTKGKAKLFENMVTNEDAGKSVGDAKQFLGLPVFERVAMQKQYDKKDTLLELCDELEVIAEAAMHMGNPRSTKRWHKVLKQIRVVRSQLKRNVTVKLAYLRLCVSI